MPICSGLGIVFRDYRPRYYEDLDRSSWQRIEGLTVPSYRAASPLGDDIPILAPVGRVALTRSVCYVSQAAGRIAKKGGRS